MKQFASIAALAVSATLLVTGCSSDNPTQQTPSQGITLTAASNAVTVPRNTSTTIQLTVGRVNSYTGDVSLAAQDLPTGITATFTPATITGGTTSSILSLTAGANAAAGTNNITVRASGSGVDAKTVTIAVTVPAPAFTLQLGGATASVTQGAATSVPVTITRTGGFDQPVSLVVEGLPQNVTAAFTPAQIGAGSTTSTLTFTAAANAAAGTSNVTVRAQGQGVTDQTSVIALTVNAATQPDFALTAAPAALSMVAGSTNQTSTITVGRTGGFAGAVDLVVEGAPAGMTATVNPTSVPGGTSTLTVATTAATAAGQHTLTIRGTAAGITGSRTTQVVVTVTSPPGVALTLTPTSLPITQAQGGQVVIIVNRTGGLTGNITMSAENLPNGVEASFLPNPVTGATTTLTLNVAQNAAPGVYNITIRGTGTGGATGTATLPLTITAASAGTIALAAVPQQVSVQTGGQEGLVTINIARGGGFTGVVNLSTSGTPNGVNVVITPQAAAGTQATIGFAATQAATPGVYNVTVTGAATGLQNATTNVQLTITAGGGGGNNVAYQFCDASRIPIWFAYKDGTAGAWTRVLGNVSNSFNFTLNSDVGGVAYVYNEGGGLISTEVELGTKAELQALAAAECTNNPPAGKNINVSVTGLSNGEAATVSMGGQTSALLHPGDLNDLLTNVAQGAQDVLAVRGTGTFIQGFPLSLDVPNRMVLLRGQNIASNGTLPAINFNDAASFAPATATITFANIGATSVFSSHLWVTPNGVQNLYLNTLGSVGSMTFYGVPTALMQAGDLHGLMAFAATDQTEQRAVISFFRTVANSTLQFGPALNPPNITSTTTGGVAHPRAQGTIQAEYNTAFGVTFDQDSRNRAITISASRGYFGANPAQYDLQTPVFVGLSGYNADWGLAPGVATSAQLSAFGSLSGTYNAPADGTTWRFGSRVVNFNP